MISAILTAIKAIGLFVKQFVTDYISNIVVGTILFPQQVLKETANLFTTGIISVSCF